MAVKILRPLFRVQLSALFIALSALTLLSACKNSTEPPASTGNLGKIVYLALDYANPRFTLDQQMLLDTAGTNKTSFNVGSFVYASAGSHIVSALIDTIAGSAALAVLDLNGTLVHQLQPPANEEFDGAADISADGKHLAFSTKDGNGAVKLYVAELDGSNQVLVTSKLAYETIPAFSHTGDKIAFYTNGPSGPTFSLYDLKSHTASILATQTRLLPDRYERVSWSMDDAWITFFSPAQSASEIHAIRPDGSGDVVIGSGSTAAWSPTANTIAYSDQTGMYVTSDLGATREIVSSGPVAPSYVRGWTLDGKNIIYETWQGDYDHVTVSLGLLNPQTMESKIVATPGIEPVVLK